MMKSLDVLLIETHPGEGAADAEQLGAAGHRVHRCWTPVARSPAGHVPTRDRYLCTGVTDGACPLDRGIDVVLLVRGRIAPRPTVGEAGVSCAIRAGVPIVERGSDILDPFEPWLTERVDDSVTRACEQAALRVFDPLAVDIRFRTRQVLATAGVEPDRVHIRFDTDGANLAIRLSGPPVDARVQQALGVRVLDAVRTSPRTFAKIDVSYEADESRS